MKRPLLPDNCDPEIARAVNTFLIMIRVNDVLVRISRKVRARKSRTSGSHRNWWPNLRFELLAEVVEPLLMDLNEFRLAGGYAAEVALGVLEEAVTYLQRPDPVHPPRERLDMQLVDEYLQPVFETLRDEVASNGWRDLLRDPHSSTTLIDELTHRTLRKWFDFDGGEELERLLQHLVSGEYYAENYVGGLVPNLFERARERFSKSPARNIRWDESGVNAVLHAVALVRERIQAKRTRGREGARSENVYFCELCDGLTQRMSNECDPSKVDACSKRYCELHASGDRNLYRSDILKRRGFDWLYKMILLEAHRDSAYRKRFLATADLDCPDFLGHISSCPFCSGRPFERECFDPSRKHFASLMAFHANARKVAYQLADRYHNGRAYLIDEAVQRGEDAEGAAAEYQLDTFKAVGQHRGLALARLLHQRIEDSEIAVRLGISPSAVSQRKKKLSGSFDFANGRDMELVWWPFDDISGPDIARFPTRALGESWRHSAHEYRHLAIAPASNTLRHQRRVASLSSLSTRSSARK